MVWINSYEYHETVSLLRSFFLSKGFVETEAQSRHGVLTVSEDPQTISYYTSQGLSWPLPQSNQMWLEYELLNNPKTPGFFCISTSYKHHNETIGGNNETAFPLFEFEMKGGKKALYRLETELLETIGFGEEVDFAYKDYHELVEHYGTVEITETINKRIEKDFSYATFLSNFPSYTQPYRNIKREGDTANKTDVILYGLETIKSGEISCNPEVMSDRFYEKETYSKTLFATFGQERVEEELKEFLSLDFFPRSSGTISITRMIRALKIHGILRQEEKYYRPQFIKDFA